MENQTLLGRRSLISLAASCLVLPTRMILAVDKSRNEIALAADLVKPNAKWGADDLYDFLNVLPPEARLSLMKVLRIHGPEVGLGALKGKSKDVSDIRRRVLWLSNHTLAYPFRDDTTLNYHELAVWVADSVGVDKALIKDGSTFKLERETQKRFFADLWDKLEPKERRELLDKIDSRGEIGDKASITAMTGASALGALLVTEYFAGFAFYTTMSTTISTVAGFFGVTLPFAAYTTASSLVGFLCGPVGWAIILFAASSGLAVAGRPDPKESAAFIFQIHALKVAALIEAGLPEKDIFG